jgi:transposase
MGPPPTPKHQLDRKNNEGPYSKDNCRWATVTKQAENRSTSFYWFVDGLRFESAGAAANHFGVKSATIHKWCHGYNNRGINIPPRANCRKERKYG